MDPSIGYRHCEAIVAGRGPQLRLRHPAAATARSAAPSAPSTRSPAASTTSATAPTRRRASSTAPRRAPGQARRASTSVRDDPVLVALADAARRYPIPLAAFDELIDGCELDVVGTGYDTFDDLVGYCRCVAGSIGRLSPRRLRLLRPRAPPRRWPTPSASRSRSATSCATSCEDAADRPRLPARARTSRASAAARARRRRRSPARPTGSSTSSLRGRARAPAGTDAASSCSRCSTGAAPPAPPRWPASTAGCSSGSRPHPAPVLRAALSLPPWEKALVASPAAWPGPAGERPVAVVGGGLAGHRRRARAAPTRRRASRCYEARSRLGGATFSFRRGGLVARQRPARRPALLHRLPRNCCAGSARRARPAGSRTVSTSPSRARAGARGLLAPRRAARARCTWRRALARLRPLSPARPAARHPRLRWRCAGSTPTDPALDRIGRSAPGWPRTGSADRDRRRSGT